jgi:peptide deformylase
MVRRPQNIHVKAYDLDMKEFELDAQDLFARAICHECDHLDGKLYIDLVEGELMDSEADEDEQEEELQ